MLVRITRNNDNDNVWDILALSGEFYGKVVARAEGVRLAKAKLHDYSITGMLSAIHGAEIPDDIHEAMTGRTKLGGGWFQECHHQVMHDERNSGWFNSETRETIRSARYLTAMGCNVFYSTKEDVEADRLAYEAPEMPSNPGLPESVAAPKPRRGLIGALLDRVKEADSA